MSNEHLEEIAEAEPDRKPDGHVGGNGNGADDLDEGPLDPSLFFGLFDDLAEDPDPQDDDESKTSDQDQAADGSDGGSGEPLETPLGEPDADDGVEPLEMASDEPRSVPVETGGPGPAAVESYPAPPADGNDTVPDTSTDNRRTLAADGSPETATGLFPAEAEARAEEPTPSPVDQSIGRDRRDVQRPSVIFTPVQDKGAGYASSPLAVSPPPHQALAANRVNGRSALASPPEVVTRSVPRPKETRTRQVKLPVQTDQAGGALAKAALLTIAAGLFGGLIAAFVVSLRNPEMPANVDGVAQTGQVTTPASSAVVEELSMANVVARLAEGSVSAEELDRLVATDMARAVKESRLDLTTMSFELGTLQLTGQAQEMVDQLGALLTEDPAIPVSALVRTYSERTAAENLALSQAQAEALVQALEVAGAAPGQVRAVGLGAIPLSPAHPVPDFVAVTPPFGDASLSAIIDNEPRFVVGNGVETVATHSAWSLRLEGLAPMTRVGQAVRSDGEATVGLAGYSFFAPTDERNDAVAKASAETVAQFLNSTYGIERQRISVITPGSAPYVPPAEVGNLIWLAAGPQSQTAHDLAAIDATAITFSGSTLSTEGQAAVEDLAAALTGSGAEIVIAVRSYDGDGTAANLALSQARGQALADSLASAGVAARQVRIEASGASTYLPADGALVSLTAVP